MIFITEKTKITEESLTVSYQSALIENLRLKILFLLSTLVTHAFFNLTKFLFYSSKSRACLIWDFHSDLIWAHSKSASYFDKLMVASVDFRQTNSWNSLPSAPLRVADGSYNSTTICLENRPRWNIIPKTPNVRKFIEKPPRLNWIGSRLSFPRVRRSNQIKDSKTH